MNCVRAEKKRPENQGEGGGAGQTPLLPPTPPPAEVVESVLSEEPIEEREESFSTGPFSKETHWKQVVFLLKEPIELYRGACVVVSYVAVGGWDGGRLVWIWRCARRCGRCRCVPL